MKRIVIQTRPFSRILDGLIKENKLTTKMFEDFEKSLVDHPKLGDVIAGSG